MRLQRASGLAPALLLCAMPCAWAEGEDVFKLNAAYTVMQDYNLFRLPDNANVTALIGRSSAAETISVTSVGASINKAYSLQRFELNVNLVDYNYRNFSYLSYTAHNFDAAWRWSFTPRLHGNLTSSRSETLNSFTDFQGYNVRNQRTDTSTRFDGVYELGGPWQVLAGVSQSSQTNQQTVLNQSDFDATSTDAGLRYVFTSGSAVTYTLKGSSGMYVNRALSVASLLDDGYSQTSNELKLHWLINGKSNADVSLAQMSRSHPHFAQRNFSGMTTSATYNWNITGKSGLSASWTRELADAQTTTSNYSLTDRFSVGPVWQISPKSSLRLRHDMSSRDYLGSPTGLVGVQRSDTTYDTTLSLDWQPYQKLSLSASLQNSRRTSNVAGLDFNSNLITLSGQYSY